MKRLFLSAFLLGGMTVGGAEVRPNEVGGTVGWGSPYGGIAVHYARTFAEIHSLGMGVGMSGAGVKYGLDYKLFFTPQESFNPYLGLALSQAGGITEMKVSNNSDSAYYNIKGGSQLTPRVGFRFKAGPIGLYVNAGYGICLSGGGVEYIAGSEKESLHDFAEILSPGGAEVSASGTFLF